MHVQDLLIALKALIVGKRTARLPFSQKKRVCLVTASIEFTGYGKSIARAHGRTSAPVSFDSSRKPAKADLVLDGSCLLRKVSM